MKSKESQKDALDIRLAQELEPGEVVIAAAVGMVGSGVWGPTSMIAKWCYFGVTPDRVIVLSLERWSYRVKGTWFDDARDVVSSGANQVGDPWSSFLYQRPDGTPVRVNYHRFWAEDMTKVVQALEITPTDPAADPSTAPAPDPAPENA